MKNWLLGAASCLLVVAVSPAFAGTNLLTNPGAETGTLAGWTVGGDSNPGVDNGSFDPGINPHSGSYDFYGHTGDSGSLSQTVDLGVVAPGTLATVSFWEQGLDQGSPSDDAYISLSFLNAANTVISSVATPEVDSHNGAWQNDTQSFAVPDGTTAIVYTMNFVRHAGSDLDAFVDDNSLTLTAAVPEPASEAMLLGALLAIAGVLRSRRVS